VFFDQRKSEALAVTTITSAFTAVTAIRTSLTILTPVFLSDSVPPQSGKYAPGTPESGEEFKGDD
jgi:hypothetical protein